MKIKNLKREINIKLSKGSPTKRAQPARKMRIPVRTGKAVLTMPTTRTVEANDHAGRVTEHRRRLESIHDAYRLSIAEVFNASEPLAEKKRCIRGNMRQLAKALGDWHCTALELLQQGQQAALLQILDLKDGRN